LRSGDDGGPIPEAQRLSLNRLKDDPDVVSTVRGQSRIERGLGKKM